MTQKQYASQNNPKMYLHTKFWTPSSSNIQILSGLDLSRTEARGQVHRASKGAKLRNRYNQVPETRKQQVAHRYQKMYPHTASSLSYNIEDMLRTYSLYH